jgi:hypothetical protein
VRVTESMRETPALAWFDATRAWTSSLGGTITISH